MLNDSSKTIDTKETALSRQPWSIFSAIAVLFFGFLIVPILLSILFGAVPYAFGQYTPQLQAWYDSPQGTFVKVAMQSLALLALLIWFVRSRKVITSFQQAVGLRAIRWKDLGYALGGAVIYAMLFVIFLSLVNAIIPVDSTKEQAIGFDRNITGASLIWAFASLVILPPIIEEIIFRGFLYGTFRRRNISIAVSIIWTSLIFGALHLKGSSDGSLLWIAFIDTFVLSVVLCYLREKTGSIWASIMLHALKNGLVFANLFLLTSM